VLVRVEFWGQLVDENVLVRLERRLHRLLSDLVRLCDEGLDDKEDDECQDERLDDLEKTPEGGSFGHKFGSIGGGRPRGFLAAGRRLRVSLGRPFPVGIGA
jgi:hypothetical protein